MDDHVSCVLYVLFVWDIVIIENDTLGLTTHSHTCNGVWFFLLFLFCRYLVKTRAHSQTERETIRTSNNNVWRIGVAPRMVWINEVDIWITQVCRISEAEKKINKIKNLDAQCTVSVSHFPIENIEIIIFMNFFFFFFLILFIGSHSRANPFKQCICAYSVYREAHMVDASFAFVFFGIGSSRMKHVRNAKYSLLKTNYREYLI